MELGILRATGTERGIFLSLRQGRKPLVDVEEIKEPSKWVTLNCYGVLSQTGGLDLSEEFQY